MSANEKMVMVPLELAEAFREYSSWAANPKLKLAHTKLNEILDQPVQQGQGEPVAWLYKGTIDGDHLRRSRMDHYFVPVGGDGSEYVKGVPLYTHADPADSRHKLAMDAACGELEIMRAQLAEAQALLREARHDLSEWVDTYGNVVSTDTDLIIEKIDAHLSASAEPSAPVEIDERAEFDAWAVRTGRTLGYLGWREDFDVWQARAALEREAMINRCVLVCVFFFWLPLSFWWAS